MVDSEPAQRIRPEFAYTVPAESDKIGDERWRAGAQRDPILMGSN